MVNSSQYTHANREETPDLKFSSPPTHTAIARISYKHGYPDLSISPEVLEAAKLKTISILESLEAMKLLKEIDFSYLKPTNQDLWQIFYLWECCNFSQEYCNYLSSKNLDVLFITWEEFCHLRFIKVWNIFFNSLSWILSLNELELKWGEYQKSRYYDSINLNWNIYLLHVQKHSTTFEEHSWEKIILGENLIQIIKNMDGSKNILDITQKYIQAIWFLTWEMINNSTLRLFLDTWKSLFIDYDWENFSALQKLKNSQVYDLSDTEEQTVPTKFN